MIVQFADQQLRTDLDRYSQEERSALGRVLANFETLQTLTLRVVDDKADGLAMIRMQEVLYISISADEQAALNEAMAAIEQQQEKPDGP